MEMPSNTRKNLFQPEVGYGLGVELTWRGELCTISTASWLLMFSQSPSEARIINSSSGLSRVTMTDGSALRIGVVKCSGSLNLGSKGSLLNSALLRILEV